MKSDAKRMENRYMAIKRKRVNYANGQIDTNRIHLTFRISKAPSTECFN